MERIHFNRDEYLDKVLGCWAGKNIGGTLGGPLEGKREVFHYDFYVNPMDGEPLPNDDLDLQLVWLRAMEDRGVYGVDERVLGEYWMAHIVAAWNEYGVGQANIRNGFFPPLSGRVNNDEWKNSNGAWIRSEIWACVLPGAPDEAASFAWCDACVDHTDDGVWAEMFTASMESAAFVESDLRKIIECGLARIPEDCRVVRSVRLAIAEYDAGHDFVAARNAVVEDSKDLGWFQAPANVAFAVIGLLYGEGDFGKSICTAVNCGDDTDCTGATVGAVFGILHGFKAIPAKWIDPIGHTIKTVAVNPFQLDAPKTLEDLTRRTRILMERAGTENPALAELVDGPTVISAGIREELGNAWRTKNRESALKTNRLRFDVPWGGIGVEYLDADGPVVEPGKPVNIRLSAEGCILETRSVFFRWRLPEGWTAPEGTERAVMVRTWFRTEIDSVLVPAAAMGAFEYLALEVRLSDRQASILLTVPFERKRAVETGHFTWDHRFQSGSDRRGATLR